MDVKFLAAQMGRDEQRKEKEREDMETKLGHTLSYTEFLAQLEIFDKKQGLQRRQLFQSVARQYIRAMRRLAFTRRDWSSELKSWHDFSASLSRERSDIHASWSETWEDEVVALFSKSGAPRTSMTLYTFAFVPGSRDRLSVPYGTYDWCKSRPYPEIQQEDEPDILRMQKIAELKLSTAITSGQTEGAAETERP